MSDHISNLLPLIPSKRILVIGDAICDVTIEVERIRDLDDGTPVYREKTIHVSPGGAALVARNLQELGAQVMLEGINRAPAVQKVRFWCEGKRIFAYDTTDLSGASGLPWNVYIPDDQADAVVVADYRHGLINEEYAQNILHRYTGKPLYVASQVAQSDSNHHWYSGPDTIFVLNEREYESAGALQCKEMYVTCGAAGAKKIGHTSVSAIDVKPVDTCGAGDAFIAALAATDGDLNFANTWAGLSTTVHGPNPPTKQMLTEWCSR